MSQLNYPVKFTITNISGQAWNTATTTLRYRWYLAGSTTSFSDSGDVASLGLAAGQTQTTQVNVSPPALPAGMDAARFTLRFDLVDSKRGAAGSRLSRAGMLFVVAPRAPEHDLGDLAELLARDQRAGLYSGLRR